MAKPRVYWSVKFLCSKDPVVTTKYHSKNLGSGSPFRFIACGLYNDIYRATWSGYGYHQEYKLSAAWLRGLCKRCQEILESSPLHHEFLLLKNFGDESNLVESYGEIRIWSRTDYTVYNGVKWIKVKGVPLPPTEAQLEHQWITMMTGESKSKWKE